MARVCREIVEAIEETVWEPIEEWVEKEEKKCKKKKCNWWCLCCNKWFCWIVTFLVKVITWVVKTVVNFVVRVVCEIIVVVVNIVVDVVGAVLNIIFDILTILWNIITFDWDDVLDGLKNLAAHFIDLLVGILDIIKLSMRLFFGGFIAGYIREQIEQNELRDYVRKRLKEKFGGESDRLARIEENINLNHGAFGLEFRCRSLRSFVDSLSGPNDAPPTLLSLHGDGLINLYEMSGVDVGNILDRPRSQAQLMDGSPVSRDDIDHYINSGGKVPHFRIYAESKPAQSQKLDVAIDKGRQLGLKLRWTRGLIEVQGIDQIDVQQEQLDAFLQGPMGRNPNGSDVCTLVAATVFNIRLPSGERPFGWTKGYSEKSPLSGLIHRDRRPDEFFKYVLIHEIGHYFSLKHEGHDGLDKIMYSPRENEWWSANLIFEFLWWSGEPRFTLQDGKKAWDFIIDRIPQCLPS